MKQSQWSKAIEEEPEHLFEDVKAQVMEEPDPLMVINADPAYDYFWAAKDESHPQSWVAMQRYGWRLVSKVGGKETNPFGNTEFKELVLMRRKRTITDEMRQLRAEKVRKYIRSAERNMEDLQERAERLVSDGAPPAKTIIV
ncbi:MAG: hypothetical protein QXZ11_00240 [Thermoproteota archaeon]